MRARVAARSMFRPAKAVAGCLVVALLVVGPKRLPEVGRMLARAMRELRRASDEFRSTIETNLNLDAPAPGPSSVTLRSQNAGLAPARESRPASDAASEAIA